MRNFVAAAITTLAFAGSANAATVGWGFKGTSVPDQSTELTWNGGGIQLIETKNQLTVQITGIDQAPGRTDTDGDGIADESGIAVWVADWSMEMDSWDTFDLYINKHNNTYCDVVITPIMRNFERGSVGSIIWDDPTGVNNGHCIIGQANANVTVQLAPMPLPAGAMLLLTGLAGIGIARRKA